MKEFAEHQVRTTKGILSIIDVVIALGQRGIPFRGNWDKTSKSEDGNFAFFVNWKSIFHKDLQDYMEHAAENGKYTSPRIQNEIISICEGVIRERIMACIPKYWSLMADETQDCSTTEQVSICVRDVNNSNEVCEDFMGFVEVKKMDAQSIADTLLTTVQKWGLDTSCLVAQGYDGASVMNEL